MKFSQLFRLIEITKLSPEEFGKRIDVSGMTIRRWTKKNGSSEVPIHYQRTIRDCIYGLIAENLVEAKSPCVQEILEEAEPPSFEAALKNLGLSNFNATADSNMESQILGSIFQIGQDGDRQNQVTSEKKKIFTYKKLGAEWSNRISYLTKVMISKDIAHMDKLVCFGALFYLITPIDLVPDHIPVFGLLDDFAILGFAMAYYTKKFPRFR